MLSPLLVSIKNATVAYNEKPIFENLTFNIHKGSRIALVGKNGAGKSTLMNIVSNKFEIDNGERWQDSNIKIRMLDQDMIRLQQKVNVVIEYRERQKELVETPAIVCRILPQGRAFDKSPKHYLRK